MKVLYFAWLRTRVGCAEEEIEPPAGIATVGQLMEWMRGRGPGYAAAFAQGAMIRAAVDQEYADTERILAGAVEVAFFPPVTGGSDP